MRSMLALVACTSVAFGQTLPVEQKVADLTELIQRKPDFAGAYYARGMTHLSVGQYWLAEADLSKVIELKPDAAAYANRAGAYAATQRTDAAIADFTKAIELKPGNLKYYLRRANMYRLKGDCQSAITDFNEVLRRMPDLDAFRGRSDCRNQLGDTTGAAEDEVRIEQIQATRSAIIGGIPSTAPPAPSAPAAPPAPASAPSPRAVPKVGGPGPIPQNVFRIGGGVSQPYLLFKVEPEYSEEARKAKWQGSVTLSIIVDEFGEPKNVTVTRALGLGLDEEAIDAVQKWVFKPARKDGEPVATYAAVEVTFHLL